MLILRLIVFLGLSYVVRASRKDEGLRRKSEYLYNISSDPYEIDNVFDKLSYDEILQTLKDRTTYWAGLTKAANSPDDTNRLDKWSQCGRVCPWVDAESVAQKKTSTKQKYSYADAPNIVYVLVDDWGYNDLGKRSTYLSWTTPTVDKLASEGVLLNKYYTSEVCAPSRASLMTGRYALRLGVYSNYDELPLTETTLAEELKTAGYRNYLVGKWHLGQSSTNYFPTNRGFDYFYGFVNAYATYWDKTYDTYVDIFENNEPVQDEAVLDKSYHSAYIYQNKAEEAIKSHAESYSDQPMFLYYAMQLNHFPWTAPEEYLRRCTRLKDAYYASDSKYNTNYALYNYCGMNIMMDEAIANLTCSLEKYGMSDNTIMIIAGDNGNEKTIPGGSYPYKGHKDSVMRGAFATTAIIHGQQLPESIRGLTYESNVHITDWYPTIMNIATGGQWKGKMDGSEMDGLDIWDNILQNTPTSRSEMVLLSYESGQLALQIDNVKYIHYYETDDQYVPEEVFENDLSPGLANPQCQSPSLMHPKSTTWIENENSRSDELQKVSKPLGDQLSNHGPPSNPKSSKTNLNTVSKASGTTSQSDFTEKSSSSTSSFKSMSNFFVVFLLLFVSAIMAVSAFILIIQTRNERVREAERMNLLDSKPVVNEYEKYYDSDYSYQRVRNNMA